MAGTQSRDNREHHFARKAIHPYCLISGISSMLLLQWSVSKPRFSGGKKKKEEGKKPNTTSPQNLEDSYFTREWGLSWGLVLYLGICFRILHCNTGSTAGSAHACIHVSWDLKITSFQRQLTFHLFSFLCCYPRLIDVFSEIRKFLKVTLISCPKALRCWALLKCCMTSKTLKAVINFPAFMFTTFL